jgi:hypothetical protein
VQIPKVLLVNDDRARSAGTPIIFMTAHYADEMKRKRLKAYQKGAALFTPVIPPILQAKVAVFGDMAAKNLQRRIKSEELAHLNQDLRVLRLQDLERIYPELEKIQAGQSHPRSRSGRPTAAPDGGTLDGGGARPGGDSAAASGQPAGPNQR